MSIGEKLLEELRERKDLREALALELIPFFFENRELRLTVLTSLYRDIATKEDIKELRKNIGDEIDGIRDEINSLRDGINLLKQRVARIEGRLDLFIKLFIVFNLPILLGIIGILLKMIFM